MSFVEHHGRPAEHEVSIGPASPAPQRAPDAVLRDAGIALLVAGLVVSAAARSLMRSRARWHRYRSGVLMKVDRPGTVLIEGGLALLNASNEVQHASTPPG
jgi:hypothetical protein